MGKTPQKTRVHLRLQTQTADMLTSASQGRYGAMSAIVDQAVLHWFNAGDDERFTIMARRIEAMQGDMKRMAEDQIVTMQAVNTFVWFFMLMTPSAAGTVTSESKAVALKRYQEFLKRLGRDIRGDSHLSDLVLEEDTLMGAPFDTAAMKHRDQTPMEADA